MIAISIPKRLPDAALFRYKASDYSASSDRELTGTEEITLDIHPIPNHARHKWARWDAYISSPDPDALFKEFQDRNIEFYQPIADTSDGLRTFETKDNNNYVLCFRRPQ